jgi:16S rRNA processing protein RimM
MENDDFYYLGRILKTFGNKGQLIILFDVDDSTLYKNLESVFVEIDHERVPFFIESMELQPNDKAIVSFFDIDSKEEAESFVTKELFLPLSALPKKSGNDFYNHEIIGFTVIDEHLGDIGIVEDLVEMPMQTLLQVRNKGREILIPVVDEIVKKVNRKTKTITVDTPEGLVELYN